MEIVMQLLLYELLPDLMIIQKAAAFFWLIWCSFILLWHSNNILRTPILPGFFSFLLAQTWRNKYITFKSTKSLEFTAFGKTASDQRSASLSLTRTYIPKGNMLCFYFSESRVPVHLMLYCILIKISSAPSNRSLCWNNSDISNRLC